MQYPRLSEEHGGLDLRELENLGIFPSELVDFSVNSNPFGPAPQVLKAIWKVKISAYPDRKCLALRRKLAQLNQLPVDHIAVGNGTTELIWMITHAFLSSKDRVLIIGPTFGEYQRASVVVGAEIIEICAQPAQFLPPLTIALQKIKQVRPRLVFLCNPNNPTGKYLPQDQIREFLHEIPENSLLVLDEAYRAFIEPSFFGGPLEKNCILLRSMTKDFALAGLRLGYMLADSEIIQRVKLFQPAWSVNSLAQAAGCAALDQIDYYRDSLQRLQALSQGFFAEIKNVDTLLVESDTHFGLIRCNISARELQLKLLGQRLQVRDCASFGLTEYIRVSTQMKEDNQKLLWAFTQLKSEGLI